MTNSKKTNSITPATNGSPASLLARDTRGLSTVEYVILLALIAVAGIGLWSEFGEVMESKITEGTDAMDSLGE